MPRAIRSISKRRNDIVLLPSIDRRPIMHEEIAERAYEIYESRGGSHGADLDDWLQAEGELIASFSQLKAS